jgi:hypothetical protein
MESASAVVLSPSPAAPPRAASRAIAARSSRAPFLIAAALPRTVALPGTASRPETLRLLPVRTARATSLTKSATGTVAVGFPPATAALLPDGEVWLASLWRLSLRARQRRTNQAAVDRAVVLGSLNGREYGFDRGVSLGGTRRV